MNINFCKDLNKNQLEAVLQTEGPILIIAGAGSGKTKVLTYKIAYLINNGIDPSNILALTFTNKSAQEMKDRISNLIKIQYYNNFFFIGTFHSVFAKILRIESKIFGYKSNYTIIDKYDSEILIKKIIHKMKLNKNIYKYKDIINYISLYKNNLSNLKDNQPNINFFIKNNYINNNYINNIYKLYIKYCFKYNVMDFDDLLFKTNELFIKYSNIKNKYQKQFKYIFVDEYQDTNYSQYFIIKTLSSFNHNICVVGDDSQSIYGFRGANINNIINFKHDYPNVKIFRLEQNYRSTSYIVQAANNIISYNKAKIKKNIWTNNKNGEKIQLYKAVFQHNENEFISNKILELKKQENKKNKDFVILYRNNIQSISIENELSRKNIPYIIYGSISFYKRRIIKIIIYYFKFLINSKDENALLKIINYPKRGIGKTTIQKIYNISKYYKKSLCEIIENIILYKKYFLKNIYLKINNFIKKINIIRNRNINNNAYLFAKDIIESFCLINKDNESYENDNINDFLINIKRYIYEQKKNNQSDLSLSNFLENILLNNYDHQAINNKNDYVSLMTIHSSKGLEFSIVFIIGLEEKILPSILSLNSIQNLEEERRLFYVAITRAKEKIFLSYVSKKIENNNLLLNKPSRFIKEINYQNIQSNINHKHINNNFNKLKVGTIIIHNKFGKGQIISIDNKRNNIIALIKFSLYKKTKKILLKLAKYKIL